MLTFTPNKQFKALLTLIFILSFSLFAQVQKETYKILGISVVGNKSADATTIIANTGLRINDELVIPSDQINNAIKRLWNLGIFEDVQLLIDKKIDKKIILAKTFDRAALSKAFGLGALGAIGLDIPEEDIDHFKKRELEAIIFQVDNKSFEELVKENGKQVYLNAENNIIVVL